MGLHDLKRSHYKCVSNLTRGIATPSTNGTECSASKDTPVMSLRGWLKPDEAISAGRYQIATHLSDARKDKKGRPRNDGGSGEKTELGPFLTAS